MATRCPHALIHLARVGSTNDYAKERYRLGAGRDVQADDLAGPLLAAARSAAAGGLPLPVDVVVADEQTAGRGRLDRTWQSRSGETLVASLVAAVPARMLVELGGGWLTSACGLACLDGLRAVLRQSGLDSTVEPPDIESPGPSLSLGLKWPNDLFCGGKKLGGILCELVPGALVPNGEDFACVVLGIGINLLTPAERLPLATAISLAVELGPAAGALPAFACLREDLLTSIARGLGQLLGELVAHPAKTTEALLLRLREESCTLGKRVEVNCGGDRRVTGVALDILPDTALLVKTDAGKELPITAGDVGVLPMGP
ncbi:MAG: biotin--[acetyl-CoA-carboxylase] ligase [Olsenella sp.]